MRTRYSVALSVTLIALGACGANPLALKSDTSQTLSLQVGQELDLTVSTVGPGAYQTPTVSSGAVTFLGDSLISPPTPAGPQQVFRFQGVSAGSAIVVLTHTGNEPTITDTVIVQ